MTDPPASQSEPTLDELIEHRSTDLTAYQNAAYADRYRSLVESARHAERTRTHGRKGLAEAVARYAYKLMAYKDEYEVGRLYSHPDFLGKLNEQFEGAFKLRFNLAPPMIAPKDKVTGLPRKMEFGGWMLPLMRCLARLRFLRGTPFDPFGWSDERRAERQLIVDYESVVAELLDGLNDDNHGPRRQHRFHSGPDPRLRSHQVGNSQGRQGLRGGSSRGMANQAPGRDRRLGVFAPASDAISVVRAPVVMLHRRERQRRGPESV